MSAFIGFSAALNNGWREGGSIFAQYCAQLYVPSISPKVATVPVKFCRFYCATANVPSLAI